MPRLDPRYLLSTAALTLLLAGCGGTTTDITAAVDSSNEALKSNGVTLDCPDEVDGGEGTEFECTLNGTKSGKSAPLQLKVAKDSIEPVDQAKYEETVLSLGGQ